MNSNILILLLNLLWLISEGQTLTWRNYGLLMIDAIYSQNIIIEADDELRHCLNLNVQFEYLLPSSFIFYLGELIHECLINFTACYLPFLK